MNIITEKTTKEEVEKDYKEYPLVDLQAYNWNRLGPIFYETPYGSTVLDIGANAGEFVELLKRDRGCNAFGVDISEKCVEEAKDKGRNVQLGNAEKLPFEDNFFDVVYLNEVLVHLFDPELVLKEAKRVLKKNGVLLGSTPHRNLEDHHWDDQHKHRRYYDEKGIEAELRKVFDDVYLKTLTGGQFAVSMANSAVGDLTAEILFKCGKDIKPWEESLLDKSVLRVWFGFTQRPADVYYRMSGYADKMREMGAEIAYESYDHNDLESTGSWQGKIRFRHIQNQFDSILKASDLSVWQITGSMDVIAFLRCIKDLFKKPILTEVDDWVFDIPSYNLSSLAYKPNSDAEWCAYQQIKLSDGVVVSTKFLEESIKTLFPEKPVYIVKNAIDFKLWEVKPFHVIPEKREGFVRIIYTGCGNHDGDVEIIKKPILALLDEFENLEVVMPIQFESWKDINHERVIYINKWLPFTKYPGMVKGLDGDIGIAPLRDNNLNSAKSNLRWLEYSALKIPSVVSKVRPFTESVIQGQTGYVCNSVKDWYSKLKELIQSKEERIRIGENAYREVKDNFNLDKVSEGYLELLKQLKKEALR